MASQYRPNISQQDIANANIANGNPILSQCGLIRERQRQYRQQETNVGPIWRADFQNLLHPLLHVTHILLKSQQKKKKKKKKKQFST